MTNAEIFPGQIEDEAILIFIRRHWMAYLGWASILMIMVLTPPVVLPVVQSFTSVSLFRGEPLIYVALITGAYYLFTSALFITTWIEHYLDVTIITPERLININQIGLFNRRVAELNLLRVQDVSAQLNGYLETLFQYGTVVVESAGDFPNFIFRFVPKPHIVANTILSLHDEVVGHSTRTATGDRVLLPAAASRRSRLQPGQLRDHLKAELKNVHPPIDYNHNHLQEDLVTQSREAQQHLHDLHRQQTEVNRQAALAAQPPPNRLPPSAQPTAKPMIADSSKKRTGNDRELKEGESVSL